MVKISLKSKRIFAGIILAIAVLGACRYAGGSGIVGLFFAIVLVIEGMITIKLPGWINFIVTGLYGMGSMIGALFVQQLVQNESMFALPKLQMLLGVCCVTALFLSSMVISGSYRFSMCLMYFVVLFVSTLNDAIYRFRGAEIMPADVLSWQTALNVAGEYSYHAASYVFYGWGIGLILCFGSYCLHMVQAKTFIRQRLFSAAALCVCIGAILLGQNKVETAHFLKTGTVDNGFILNFVYQIPEAFVKKPKGYDGRMVQDFYPDDASSTGDIDAPDIIVIMNESFADLSVLGEEIHTDIPIMPYFDSLTENTVKGYALSSVFGGGTPNSEYEFLTGNTLAFLPEGSIVYQQFLKEDNYSILSNLETQGYKTFATHPYLSNGWLRDSKWASLGFDSYSFVDDYSQKNMLRELVSDEEMYDYLIKHYEKNLGDKQFIFGVTMQNHGAYDYDMPNFAEEVHLVGYEGTYPDVEQYLSLVHSSDAALEKLISYFMNVNRPVVILFYGDHLPGLDQDFYREVHGGRFEGVDEAERMYKIPFFVWTNYDTEERSVNTTSINYLSNYLYEAAELPLPPYNQMLKMIEEDIPAINALGYFSKADDCYKMIEEAEGEEEEILLRYSYLEYNNMFDVSARNTDFFPLNN